MHLSRAVRFRLFLLLPVALAVLAQSNSLLGQPPGRQEKATLKVLTDRTAYEAGAMAQIAAKMDIERHWHTNSHLPTFDYLIGTNLQVESPAGWPAAEISYPTGELKTFAFADKPISVYEGEVAIMAHLEIPADTPAGSWPLEATLTYQACDDRSCLPPVDANVTVTLTIGTGGEASLDPVFAAASESGSTSVKPSTSLPLILFLGVLGGLILNAMPCVLPVLSLKIFGLVKSAGHGRSHVVLGSLATSLGILLSFWALALAAVIAKSAGGAVGWGVQFQEPVFVAILAIIVLLFCLNLWGVFEIPLPHRLATFADSGPREGLPGHLASGLFATLMATPCSAPFLGTAVGFALSQSTFTIFAVFTAIAAGMALPYLALAAAPGVANWLPKPGPWMQNLRVVMGFLLAAAAVWLFYVLAAQMSRERLAFIELALLFMAMFVWMRHQSSRGKAVGAVALVGILATIATSLVLAAGAQTHKTTGDIEVNSGLVSWISFDRQEAESLVREGRLVFVDVTADWCFTCKVNEELVLETPEVAAVFESHEVIAMKADWTNRSDTIAKFLADHGRYGIPFYMLYRPGQEPHVFGELLTKEGLISVVRESATGE